MKQQKKNKPNRGFRRAFRAGIILVLFLSFIISWISIVVINSVNNRHTKIDSSKVESEVGFVNKPDTFFVEKIKEIRVRDTVYKYVQPAVQVKPKTEESVAPKRDTLSE